MEKIVICIPTFNRPLVIKELIVKYGEYFEKLGYDLNIYDSSDNDETQQICYNLGLIYKFKYIHMSKTIHSNTKVYRIYQDKDLLENYNYIWIWSDSIRWSENILYKIKNTKDFDFVVLNHRDKENVGDRIYESPQNLFEDAAWQMTLYGATIVNTNTILKNIQWEKYENKYLTPDCINFSHVCFYFERMRKLRSPQIMHYSINTNELMVSSLKGESGWYKDIFFIWWECWYNAVNKLDGYYNKGVVIKKLGRLSGYFTAKGMIILRIDGKYSLNVFVKYFMRIKRVTDVSLCKMFLIALMPKKLAFYYINLNYKKLIIHIKKLSRKYSRLYIYGCGSYARVVANKFNDWGIYFDGFCVTKKECNHFMGKEVVQYSPLLLKDKNVGIVLGMNNNNSCQVLELFFKETEIKNRVFIDFNNYWEQLSNG